MFVLSSVDLISAKFKFCDLLAQKYATMADSEPVVERTISRAEVKDEEVLAEFGYKQELKRDWGLTHNFGISFSIIVRILYLRTFPLLRERS